MSDVITENLDLWTSAILNKSTAGRGNNGKQEAYGIKKLRELILELAVRGKLLPQDPSDTPANVLLEKISKEKAALIKKKKIRKPKMLPVISAEEMLYKLPVGWEWVRLQDITTYVQRGKGPKYSDDGRVRVISQKCIQWAGFDISQARYVDDESLDKYQPERYIQNNDLLWNSTGTGTVGRVNVITNIEPETIVADSHVTVIRPLQVNSNFIGCYIGAPGIQLRIDPKHEDSLVSGTTKQVELNTSTVIPLVLPVPPLAEQHRIVAKVDELMALCDQLEQQQTDSIDAQQTLVKSLLDTLTDVESAEELSQAWTRIADHFDTLFTTEHDIDQLKQTILQLAIMGKLVPQDPNDEPANQLLDMIVKEKEQLVEAGMVRKQKELKVVDNSEFDHELPEGWALSRLGTFTAVGTGATPSRDKIAYWSPHEVSWVTSGETGNDFVEETREKISSLALAETNVSIYPVGTLIVAMYGQGKTRGQITELLIEAGTNQACAAIVLVNKEISHRRYIKYFFKKAYEEIRSFSAGGAQPNLNVGKIANTVIPLPPLAEQGRIVQKVKELMALCDTLKARITVAQTTQIHLADSIVEQAIA